ncbi:MAG: hypothetical protein K2L76_06230 [Muribaculaceae bacterium]|nr:hypothetical protein [Muribaculaceae bacterium]
MGLQLDFRNGGLRLDERLEERAQSTGNGTYIVACADFGDNVFEIYAGKVFIEKFGGNGVDRNLSVLSGIIDSGFGKWVV